MEHGYKGVFHLTFDASYDSLLIVEGYNSKNSLLPSNDIIISKIDDEIIQAEIALRDVDFHITNGRINIQIELVETPKGPEQLPSNSEYLWKVFLPVLNSKEPSERYWAATFLRSLIIRS